MKHIIVGLIIGLMVVIFACGIRFDKLENRIYNLENAVIQLQEIQLEMIQK